MRPLPRVHAYTDTHLLSQADFGIRAAAIAAAGPVVALHARARDQDGSFLAAAAERLLALARPPEAAVLVSGRSDIAAAIGAQGVQLGSEDLSVADARQVLGRGWIGRSVHSRDEGIGAIRDGADFLVVGSVYATPSHPERAPVGLGLLRELSGLGVPLIAIGGITSARAWEVRSAGAYGVAAITTLWHAADSAAATLALLEPWISEL